MDMHSMKFLAIFEAAGKWSISYRCASILYNQGSISSIQQPESRCIISEDAEKPADARIKSGKYTKAKAAWKFSVKSMFPLKFSFFLASVYTNCKTQLATPA